jgi:S1-C subfamily serine protease
MRSTRRLGSLRFAWPHDFALVAIFGFALISAAPLRAQTQAEQPPALDELLSAVVRVKTFINPDARTTENLGHERIGSGIVIDGNGLVLTIGYLMVEAHAAEIRTNDGRNVPANVVGYDNETGFGLLQAISPLKVRPMAFGKSAEVRERDQVLAASFGGRGGLAPALIVAKREFAGNWEYLLDEALFTAPAHSDWSGAALITREGKLVGVGSLIVNDATGKGGGPGNMYVPIDLLPPILGELMSDGRVSAPAKPWLGMNAGERGGNLFVGRVTAGGPAEKAGLRRGDLILGVNGAPPTGLADFYRKIWAQGAAGVSVPLDVQQGNEKKRIEIRSINRMDHLKLKSTL